MDLVNGQRKPPLPQPDLKSEDFLRLVLTGLREAVRQHCDDYLRSFEAEVTADVHRQLEADRQAIKSQQDRLDATVQDFEARVQQEADRRTEYERKKIEREREEFEQSRLKMSRRLAKAQALVDRYCLALEKIRDAAEGMMQADDLDTLEDWQKELERVVQIVSRAMRDE